MKKCNVASVIGLTIMLNGCAVSIRSSEATIDSRGVMRGEGIAYYLPKTLLEVEQPVTLIPAGGALIDKWAGMNRICEENADQGLNPIEPPSPKIVLGSALVKPRVTADTSKLYRAEFDSQIFSSLESTLDLGPTGVLGKADSSVTNNTYQFVAAVAKAAISLATSPVRGLASKVIETERTKPSVSKKTLLEIPASACFKQREYWGKVDLEKPISCKDVVTINACVKDVSDRLDSSLKKRQALLDAETSKPTQKGPDLKELISQSDTVIEADRNALAEAYALYGVGDGPSPVKFVLKFAAFEPTRNKPSWAVDWKKSLLDGTLTILPFDDLALGQISTLRTLLNDSANGYSHQLKVEAESLPIHSADSDAAGPLQGYRYRIPIEAAVSLAVFDGKKSELQAVKMIQPIAQLGPIASLNSRFKGKAGKVKLELWPETGGLKSVTLGSTALPTAEITGVIDKGVERLTADRTLERIKAQTAQLEAEAARIKAEALLKCLIANPSSSCI